MHSLNPFLRAFFKSNLPSLCNPINNHILLVPTTDSLLTAKNRETNTLYADIATSEEFLASHVLRVSGTAGPEEGSVRDNRGKAKQFSTINGRTVMVKESFVYGNKGFKYLNQAQLLSDVLYFSNQIDSQQWLIYYISKPLVGQFEPIKVTSANISDLYLKNGKASDPPDGSNNHRNEATSTTNGKKEIKSFNDLLNSFPLIARQMQPGLERVFKEFNQGINQRDSFIQSRKPALVRRMSGDSSRSSGNGSVHSNLSASHGKSPSIKTLNVNAEEDYLRQILETAVTSTIDLFQQVDKQQLSFLGTTTELTGPIVERHIERYVTEQLHDSTIFPMLSNSRKLDDLELESRLHQMQHVDISQVGIAIHNGRRGKQQLMKRLARSVEEFRKLGVAGSPQEMTGILLTSLRIITEGESSNSVESRGEATGERALMHEKSSQVVAMNADSLVSLLLVVVIRSQVRHLHARLTYMKNFIFIDDVQSGELGYALSTFEAVLSYLANDSVGLRLASRRNHRLWDTAKNGKLSELQAILNPEHELMDSSVVPDIISVHGLISEERAKNDAVPMVMSRENGDNLADWNSTASVDHQNSSNISTLAHVFPFQAANDIYQEEPPSRKVKRVSMDMRSLSASFEPSLKSQRSSRTSTIDSKASAIEGDTSIDTLLQTQDFEGNSVLMMAVEHQQATILRHLLTLEHFYPLNVVLEDWNCEGTTLLNAAVQLAHEEVIDVILHRVLEAREQQTIVDYLSIADIHGRTAAHYLFNAPHLIRILGNVLPWRQRDKNGQTPLLALCRSYDHPNYSNMINEALYCATQEQHDGQPLHLDLHVDSKGNTLLHVVNDPQLAVTMLQHCDSDPNVANDRRFTPLMMASKYGRVDMVRAFFGDRRVDIAAREARGMTAVELAKDDEVRNRIDDMVLVSTIPRADGRVSAVVRSFLVEDGSVRLIIKSAVRSDNGLISVTTCRRSLSDFENLAQWLSREHPASWLPSIFNFRSPFQIPSKPSRATLQDIQVQLDGFLKIMLAHSTFSSHELLWEFILFPEIQPEMMAERSQKKAEIRNENITEDYEPMEDVRDIEAFVDHARESIYAVNLATKTLARRVASLRHLSADMSVALNLCAQSLSTFSFVPASHISAFSRYSSSVALEECDSYRYLHQDIRTINSTIMAILSSLSRPQATIASLDNIQRAIDRHQSSLRRSGRWPLGLLDETRKGIQADALQRAEKSAEELRTVRCELSYTQQTLAGELAGWQELHAQLGRRAIRALAERMVIREKNRLESMKRATRELGIA